MDAKHYDISILICTYEQPKDKVLMTLASAVIQKGISFQVIISDDGSSVVYTNDYIRYMEKYDFTDYEILVHEKNRGTMKNFESAIAVAKGDYIKAISPGDCFTSEDCLKLWLDDIKIKDSQLSFCDSVYYNQSDEGYRCVIEVARPQKPEIYNRIKKLQQQHYLIYDDIFLGAAILSERITTQKYITLMSDKIKYAEDNIYRLMILDGVNCSYFCHNAIFYEWGTGVSTQPDSLYSKQLDADWEAASQYIYNHCPDGYFGRKLKVRYSLPNEKRFSVQWFIRIMVSIDQYFYHKKQNKGKRMTQEMSLEFLNYLETMRI